MRLKEKRGSLETQTIPRRTGSEPAPLSFAQQQLWFLDQLEPGGAQYNLPMGLRLKGHLNLAVLQECLNQIVQRHAALRTHFETVEGQPVQVIQPVASLEVPLVDLRGLPEQEREAQARRLCMQESQRPFDLARDLMLRARVFRLGETDHVLFFNMHHVASDEWSVYVLIRELKTLYRAFCEGKPSPLPELPIQYADYAVWQRDGLRGEALEKQLNYWKKQLEGAPALLELPSDRPRSATQSYRGALMLWELPATLPVALGELSRREGATFFMTLLAGFQTLLHRYTGAEDILVGSPIAGRTRTEMEPLIGFFVNTLVMRGDLSGNPSFRTLLGRTREAALGAYSHQDLPFERLVEELHPGRDLSHSLVFQAMFVLQNTPWEAAQLAGLEVTPMLIDSGTSKFDLTFSVRERGGVQQAVVEYNTDLFEAETIRRMLGHYQMLLEGIVANPDQRLSDLPLLTSAERQQLLVDWNQTQQEYPRDKCVHELFEEQVERAPEATAVIFEDQRLTYRQLNERATRLARQLQIMGVGPDRLVGICVERSLEMVVGLLGILKAGGAFVPLDPEYPQERLAFMLKDANPKVLVTQGKLQNVLPAYPGQIVCLDGPGQTVPEGNKEETLRPNPANLAYVIYTSGSTGQSKGVLLEHGGLCNLVQALSEQFEIRSDSRVLQFASLSFDASVAEIFSALLAGAALVVARREALLPGAELAGLLREQAISVVTLPPSVLAVLPEEAFPQLRTIVSAGEACTTEIVSRWQPGRRFINGYGPTESTVGVSLSVCRDEKARPSIGRPIANTQLYILDGRRQPVPVGVSGELYIGGVGVARGYLNRPELTAQKFIADSFSAPPGCEALQVGRLGAVSARREYRVFGAH